MLGFAALMLAPVLGKASTRKEQCEAGIRTYFQYEKKGRNLLEDVAPNGATACRNAVADIEATTILLPAECGSYVFDTFESPEKRALSKVSNRQPADTVLDVISKARSQHIEWARRFCGMEALPIGVSQDAADCRWYIEVQLKQLPKMHHMLFYFDGSKKECMAQFERYKRKPVDVPEACRRYTISSFPGVDTREKMMEQLAELGLSSRSEDNVVSVFRRIWSASVASMGRICSTRKN